MTTAQQEIKHRIREFVVRAANTPHVGDDDNLFESGIVNSLFAIQLLTFIEKTFAIEVGADDLDLNNFRSLNATAAFVNAKTAPTAPGIGTPGHARS
jgi:acyl carrier protein